MLTLNGLRITSRESDDATQPGADIVWRTERVDTLPSEPQAGNPIAIVRGEPGPAGVTTDHIFGYDGRVRCRFRIAPDAASIDCRALAEVSDRDLFSLFAEPVMRTILVRRGLLSFHAAALVKDGRAILIMAHKGVGKSSLSFALQGQGWQLLADDLSRVEVVDGQWRVFFGHRQTKLTPEAASAFGYALGDMPGRFDNPGPASSAALFDKRIIDAVDVLADPSVSVPLAAFFVLAPRDASATALRYERLPLAGAVRQLLEHVTPDPLGGALSPAMQWAVGGFATGVKAMALTLPDSFDRLSDAAGALATAVLGPDAPH